MHSLRRNKRAVRAVVTEPLPTPDGLTSATFSATGSHRAAHGGSPASFRISPPASTVDFYPMDCYTAIAKISHTGSINIDI